MNNTPATGPRINFFLACEGESERSYVKFLDNLAKEHGRMRVHLDPFVINGGGDPHATLERSKEKHEVKEKGKKGGYRGKMILMDGDIFQRYPCNKKSEFMRQLNAAEFGIIWQDPDHEGFLIRHLSGSVVPTLGETLPQLQQLWPSYRKNMPAPDIERKLDINCVTLASKSIPEFKQFLKIIGFNV